jgi:hypothetical protein
MNTHKHGHRRGMSFLKEVCVNEMDKNINIDNHSKDTNMNIERLISFSNKVCVNEKEKNINICNYSKDTKETLNWVVGKVYTLIQQKY